MSLNDRCGDCGVAPGEEHHLQCDVARCLATGLQRIQCRSWDCCVAHEPQVQCPQGHHDCGRDVWTGEWPGLDDASRLGFWCYWDKGWVRCDESHPHARPDLNRLGPPDAFWDPEAKRWERSEVFR